MASLSLRAGLGVLLSALPWLNPLAFGPSAAVVPWLVSAACAWGLVTLAGRRIAAPGGLVLACTILFGWAVVSLGGIQPKLLMLAGGLALMACCASLASDAEVTQSLLLGVVVAAVLGALFGLCQYFGLSDRLAPWVNSTHAGQAFGNLRQPNQYATLCCLGLAVLLWSAPRVARPAVACLTVLLAMACAASVSRTGLLQGLMLFALGAAWPSSERRWRLHLCAIAALAYLAATIALPLALEAATGALPERTLWGRIGGDGASCSSRIVLWSNVLDLIARKPLLGWGWGELDYAHFITLYRGDRFCNILDNAHNLPLHLAVELGVPAALWVCGGFLWWAVHQRPWAERDPQRQLAWAVLALVLLHSFLEYPLWYGPFQILFGASLGWLLTRPTAPPAPVARGLRMTIAAALFAAIVYAATDYWRVSQIYLPPQQRTAFWRDEPLSAAKRSRLFASEAEFAELTLVPLTLANAGSMQAQAEVMLHYSPEPRVIERLIESAAMNGHEDKALSVLARYRAAFPREYEQWRARQRSPQD